MFQPGLSYFCLLVVELPQRFTQNTLKILDGKLKQSGPRAALASWDTFKLCFLTARCGQLFVQSLEYMKHCKNIKGGVFKNTGRKKLPV